MLEVVLRGRKKLELRDVPKPQPTPQEVVVEIKAGAICGSDLHAYRSDGELDIRAGHEACGVIAEALPESGRCPGERVMIYCGAGCGRCVYCRAGGWIICPEVRIASGFHSEYALVPPKLCLPLPDDIDFEVGALLGDALGTPYSALKRLEISPSDTLVIFGQGPIGLHATALAKLHGATVIAIDFNEYRLSLARELGADHIINPAKEPVQEAVSEVTGGMGAEKVMDCSGHPQAEELALDIVKRWGRVAFVGENLGTATIKPSHQFIRKELTVIGSWYFRIPDYESIVNISRKLPLDKIITHRFPLEEAEDAYRTFDSGLSGKVLLIPGGNV